MSRRAWFGDSIEKDQAHGRAWRARGGAQRVEEAPF